MGSQDSTPTLYFGYGSNLWLHQMALRCPTSRYLGVARLHGWRWIINERGYANVIQPDSPSPSPTTTATADEVYGLVYALTPADEARLDINEGVPKAYTKEFHTVEFWPSPSPNNNPPSSVDVTKPPEEKSMLVYVDRKRLVASSPKKEYVHRMNRGIADAVSMGVPKGYVERVLRRFIKEEKEEEGSGDGEGREVEAKALRQAGRFVDENFSRDV
jgi:hypothetical protein